MTPASRWPWATDPWPGSSPTWPRTVAEEVAPVVDGSGCTARMLEHLSEAVAGG